MMSKHLFCFSTDLVDRDSLDNKFPVGVLFETGSFRDKRLLKKGKVYVLIVNDSLDCLDMASFGKDRGML